MAEIKLDHYGVGRTARRFRRMGRNAEDFRPVFRKLQEWIREDERARFASQPWRPLDPDTIRRKARQGRDPRIMREIGTLERAVTKRGARGSKSDTGRLSMFIGLRRNGAAYYAHFHDEGDGTPKRRIYDMPTRTRLRFYQAVQRHLRGD